MQRLAIRVNARQHRKNSSSQSRTILGCTGRAERSLDDRREMARNSQGFLGTVNCAVFRAQIFAMLELLIEPLGKDRLIYPHIH